jgi:hypothetical protein
MISIIDPREVNNVLRPTVYSPSLGGEPFTRRDVRGTPDGRRDSGSSSDGRAEQREDEGSSRRVR